MLRCLEKPVCLLDSIVKLRKLVLYISNSTNVRTSCNSCKLIPNPRYPQSNIEFLSMTIKMHKLIYCLHILCMIGHDFNHYQQKHLEINDVNSRRIQADLLFDAVSNNASEDDPILDAISHEALTVQDNNETQSKYNCDGVIDCLWKFFCIAGCVAVMVLYLIAMLTHI